MNDKYVTLWQGRPLPELTKEELIEAVETLATLMENMKNTYDHDMKMFDFLEKTRNRYA